MESKKNPLIAGLLTSIPSIVSGVVGIIKDKKQAKTEPKETTTTGEAVIESIKEITSGTISSKRLLNIGGTALIITLAVNDITANSITKLNLVLIAVGAVYSLGMTLITWLSERK